MYFKGKDIKIIQRNKKFIHLFPFEKNFISPNVAAGFVAVCINDNDLPLMPS